MSTREQQRGRVIAWALAGSITNAEGAQLTGLSVRHFLRLKAACQRDGPGVLAHGNRGRAPGHATSDEVRGALLTLARAPAYRGYNHTHLHEVLKEQGIEISRRSVSRILTAAGSRSPRRRRPRRHHARRQRSAQRGLLVQVDASQHDWLEGRGPRLTLVGAVDDATGELLAAHFQPHEDSAGYLRLLRDSVRRHGVPAAWYADRHGAFQRNDKEPWTLAEQLAGGRAPTQVGRALAELGIQLIPAYTPQAKGRVERCWGTLQDRMVKDLRRAGVATCDQANAFLDAYRPRFNQRFAVPARQQDAFHRLPRGTDLDGVCSFQYVRTVANDNTVRLEERLVQIPPGPKRRSYARCRVDLQEHLDGTLVVLYKKDVVARDAASNPASVGARGRRRGRELLADARPAPTARGDRHANPRKRAPTRVGTAAPQINRRPPPDHPWRRPWVETVTKSLAK